MHLLTPILGLFNLGTPEIFLIAFVIMVFFGAKRMPELARAMGKSVKEFKKATTENDEPPPADGQP
jgi:sec-independent protein translocase protein TatA